MSVALATVFAASFDIRHSSFACHAVALATAGHSPNILLDPGTSSVEYLRENGADGISDPATAGQLGSWREVAAATE
jgi:hypothetical protein